jgi:hypothetical protein
MKSFRGHLALAAWCGAIALGWLVVLPWLSALPSQKENIEWLREQRIDPSARYYTEVEAMEPILERLNSELTGRTVSAQQKTPGLP